MKKVFIAGPFRGDGSSEVKNNNVTVARRYVMQFIEKEIPFYSPHMNLDQELIDFPEDRSDFAVAVNNNFLQICDALAVLPGWETSSGTQDEIAQAQSRNIPIFYLEQESAIQDILLWLSDK